MPHRYSVTYQIIGDYALAFILTWIMEFYGYLLNFLRRSTVSLSQVLPYFVTNINLKINNFNFSIIFLKQ